MGVNKPVVFLVGLVLAAVLGAANANENEVSTTNNEGATVTTSRCTSIQSLSDLVQQQSATIEQQSATIGALHLAVQQQGATIQALQSSVQVVQTSIQTLSTDNRQHSQTLDSRARSAQVAFSAHMATPYSVAVGADSPIVFSVVVTNLGGAYNPDTGVFTAPNAGLYVFHFAVINDGAAATIHVAIAKNGQVLSVGTADAIGGYNNWDDATALVTTHLDQGDRVYVKRRDGGTALYGGEYCNFSGFLLALDDTA